MPGRPRSLRLGTVHAHGVSAQHRDLSRSSCSRHGACPHAVLMQDGRASCATPPPLHCRPGHRRHPAPSLPDARVPARPSVLPTMQDSLQILSCERECASRCVHVCVRACVRVCVRACACKLLSISTLFPLNQHSTVAGERSVPDPARVSLDGYARSPDDFCRWYRVVCMRLHTRMYRARARARVCAACLSTVDRPSPSSPSPSLPPSHTHN